MGVRCMSGCTTLIPLHAALVPCDAWVCGDRFVRGPKFLKRGPLEPASRTMGRRGAALPSARDLGPCTFGIPPCGEAPSTDVGAVVRSFLLLLRQLNPTSFCTHLLLAHRSLDAHLKWCAIPLYSGWARP